MISSILQKLGWIKADEEPRVVSIEVPEDVIREKMKESRDFIMKVTEDGDVSGYCKSCETDIFVAQDEMVIWFNCKSCNRYSFNPLGNVKRDAAFAEQDGQPLECEGFFIDFPPQLKPPAVFDSILLSPTRS